MKNCIQIVLLATLFICLITMRLNAAIESSHPRYLVKGSDDNLVDIAELRLRCSGSFSSEYQQMKNYCDSKLSTSTSGFIQKHYMRLLRNYCFMNLVNKDGLISPVSSADLSNYRSRIIQLADELILLGHGGERKETQGVRSLAYVVDWCYDYLMNSEPTKLASYMDIMYEWGQYHLTAMTFVHWDGSKWVGDPYHSSYNNHQIENLTGLLMAYVTLYGHSGTGWGETELAKWWVKANPDTGQWSDIENCLKQAGKDGGWYESVNYALTMYYHSMEYVEILKAATIEERDEYTGNSMLENTPKFYLYTLRPDNMTTLFGGGDFNGYSATSSGEKQKFGIWMASYEGDGYANTLIEGVPGWAPKPNYNQWPLYIMYYNKNLSKPVIADMAKSAKFDGPGLAVIRTGWELGNPDSDDIVIFYSGGRPLYGGWKEWQAGNFEIWHKGMLALSSGRYNLNSDPHNSNYRMRTVAGNCITVYQSGEDFGGKPNDGGQKCTSLEKGYYQKTYSPDGSGYKYPDFTNWDYSGGRMSRFKYDETKGYTYIMSDLEDSYHDDKINNLDRALVFFNDGYLIMFDRVTASFGNYEKRWTLHSQPEPGIDGTWTGGVSPNAQGGTPGQTSTNTDEIVLVRSDNHNNTPRSGKLMHKILLPLSHTVRKIGGPDQSGNYNTSGSYDFFVDGQNYPSTDAKYRFPLDYTRRESDPGRWRYEIIPSGSNQTDEFLNVLYITESGTMAPTSIIENISSTHYGSHIKADDPICVVFSKDGSEDNSVTFAVTQSFSGTARFLICDLQEANYEVRKNGMPLSGYQDVNVGLDGTLYFEDTSFGQYSIGISGTTADTDPPAAPVGLRIQ
ncbi:MAG: hypothetical protein K8F52_07175 [Candidatus Scalindua rubra]|uniref:Heparin and heparin-sulfate lyase n=1 Tax=Candidatus Scalindua brodae TaxID=237368 RepID=A0A0B0EJL7_9BACT|nr:MAG: Heparin and heparin-sulfate lyase precursor [Candidatus Scalindua brodae]MBZ0108435.1 hypothetical protein [Candidatus Scalindua rubra]TWU28795.1 Heparin and heparin-sulfate lyase precursor [Candidatus Brocadiaceae bacterium S225]